MPAEQSPENTLASGGRKRSGRAGDAPESVLRRYFTDDRGGPGKSFYVDATVSRPAFRDRGDRLATDRADPNAIRDMVAIAKHRGWMIVEARGSEEFRREAWLAGRQAGLEVRGYRPTERDLQDLERRRERWERGEIRQELQEERRDDRRDRAQSTRDIARARREDGRGGAQMRVVEAVVRARVQDEEGQRRILGNARDRIASWLERGASFPSVEPQRERGPERARGR